MDLVVRDADRVVQRLSLPEKGTLSVGRHSDNDVVLDEIHASRQHCRLVREGGETYVEDMGSGNGTLLRGELISPNTKTKVDVGDALAVGSFTLTIEEPAQPDEGDTASSQGAAQAQGKLGMLEATGGPLGGQRFGLGTDPILIGRGRRCNVQIVESLVSRRNTRIVPTDEGYLVQDLGSTNGTFVNGQRIDEVTLREGDVLRVGDQRFRFYLAGPEDMPDTPQPATPAGARPGMTEPHLAPPQRLRRTLLLALLLLAVLAGAFGLWWTLWGRG